MIRIVEDKYNNKNHNTSVKKESFDGRELTASQKRGYRDAVFYVKKYAKAMRVLG